METIAINKNFYKWILLLRISIGVIYCWFGVLKFFPGVSPAKQLAENTIHLLTFGLLSNSASLFILAVWETGLGLILVAGILPKIALRLALAHMLFTFTPLLLLPRDSFNQPPFALTLVGQYILKNIVIISALLVINSIAPSLEKKNAER
jgi:uncharacterized membrane protein YphA (DoxX/SURF4 family)